MGRINTKILNDKLTYLINKRTTLTQSSKKFFKLLTKKSMNQLHDLFSNISDPISIAIQLREMHPIMTTAQRKRSHAIEEIIISLAALKLQLAAKEDSHGFARIYKQQVEAAKRGLLILQEVLDSNAN